MRVVLIGGPACGGAGVLTMFYANGIGATRNVDLALRFACEIQGAPNEMRYRIEHLQSFQGNDFDLCQDITSGYMSGVCSDHDKKFTDIKRQDRLQDKLQKASHDFIEARVRNEVDQTGTLRAAMMISEEQGKPNRYTQQDLSSRDEKMQAALAKIAKAKFEFSTVTPEKIALTQKAWESYRDAFAEFAAKHYAGTPEYSVRAWLIAKRVHMLASFQ